MVRAGGDYEQPWIRDAVLNTWNGANITEPRIARNTLLAVCERINGRVVIQQDNQDWDRIIWIVGAWQYVLATGDREFAALALEAAQYEWQQAQNRRFNRQYGLFTGGSFFNDGISGYPLDLYEPGCHSGFQGDHPKVRDVMTLSVNCLACEAYKSTAELAEFLGGSGKEYREKAEQLAGRIRMVFETPQGYGYLLYPDGRLCRMQEACGQIFAALFSVCEDAGTLLKRMERSPAGLASICPDFAGVRQPARHNQLIWPFINGLFIRAAAQAGETELAGDEWEKLTALFLGSGLRFFEIYDRAGQVEGGWQSGDHYDSCRDQTWSASLCIGAVLYGFLGLRVSVEGTSFHPAIPRSLEGLGIEGLLVRDSRITLTTEGAGNQIESMQVNGQAVSRLCLPFEGEWQVHLRMSQNG